MSGGHSEGKQNRVIASYSKVPEISFSVLTYASVLMPNGGNIGLRCNKQCKLWNCRSSLGFEYNNYLGAVFAKKSLTPHMGPRSTENKM